MSFYHKVLEKIKDLKFLKQERGAILVLTALLLPIIFGCLGIGYDIGNLYMHKARLQNVADAAALAGGRAYLDSQTKTTGVKDTIDDNTNGNADQEYVIGGSKTRGGKHPDADRAADEYIYRNIINLGEKVYSDKYSHYALKGLKKSGENYAVADEIFYRIGLYETVPLRFLPLLTNKYNETVRAGAVALIQPGTTPSGGGGSSTTIKNPSIFDNLFTYSEHFDPGLTNANSQHNATFEGNMVFTYGNGQGTQEHFYDLDALLPHTTQGNPHDRSTDHLFVDDSATIEAINNNTANAHWHKVNDPIVNTYYNTVAYVQAFKSKLNQPHYDATNQNVNITGDQDAVSTCRQTYTVASGSARGNYQKVGEDYYLLKDNNEYTTFENNGKTYTVCYHTMPQGTNYVARCGKTEGDNAYYMLTADNRITNCYIKSVPAPGNPYWIREAVCLGNDTTNYYYNNGTYVDMNWQPVNLDGRFSPGKPETPIDKNNFILQSQSGSESHGSTNIYHITSSSVNSNNVDITAKGFISGEDQTKPIYVIIDESMTGVIMLHVVDNTRPIVVVNLGTSNVRFENPGANHTAKMTIYAPYSNVGNPERINFAGTFRGNIIAKTIMIQPAGVGHWIQQNYLDSDEDVAAVTKTIEEIIKNSAKLPDDIKAQVMQRYANALNMNPEAMSDPLFYSKLGYGSKQQLYSVWRSLLTEFPEYANQLWPWNEHFDIQSGEEPVTTNEILRLINYRTEYQTKADGSIEDGKVLDPFIFETLGKPNSY